MADIEIVYLSDAFCDEDCKDYSVQCHTFAADSGCPYYVGTKSSQPCPYQEAKKFGPCANAILRYVHKGWSGTNYEIIPGEEDPYCPKAPIASVKLGRNTYECAKVTLNGKVIYNNYDDDTDK